MKLGTSALRKLLLLFSGFQFFFSLLLWAPIFYDYQKTMGLSDVEIFKIQSLYYLIFCLVEIPTGYLADWLGYRLCLILGGLTLVVANLLVPFDPSYQGFLLHFALVALARSFVSGASSAYLYESLHTQNQLALYKETEGKARAYSLLGKVVCWACVGWMMQLHLSLPYWLTALNALISVLFAYYLPEVTSKQKKNRVSLIRLFNILRSNVYLLLVMLQGVALFVLARICQVNLFQPILERKGFSVVHYGMVMAAMTLFEALGSFQATWVKKYLSDLYATFFFTCMIGVCFFGLSIDPTSGNQFFGINIKVLTLISLCLFSFFIGISFPIQRQLMNQAIPEPQLRASLLSTESIIDRAINSLVAQTMAAALAAGHLMRFLQESALLTIGSVFIITMCLIYIRKKR